MEKSVPVTNHRPPVSVSASPRSVARMCGSFALRCLKAVGDSYVQSTAYNPYWIAACPVPRPVVSEEPQG